MKYMTDSAERFFGPAIARWVNEAIWMFWYYGSYGIIREPMVYLTESRCLTLEFYAKETDGSTSRYAWKAQLDKGPVSNRDQFIAATKLVQAMKDFEEAHN